jgi:DNA-binding transcriptional ArsR family regulator
MPEGDANFHNFALHSILFKGRSDWYFCFLKAEKIAQVLAHLAGSAAGEQGLALRELARQAGKLPEAIARFVAGEVAPEEVLADTFSLRSAVRFAGSAGDLSRENALLISAEYERIAERLGTPGRISPFISSDDFKVAELPPEGRMLPGSASLRIKDTSKPASGNPSVSKGHIKDTQSATPSTGRQERLKRILEVVRKRGSASIKDIASDVPELGEKTIQRELAALIEEGLVRKEGERRWSVYKPVSGI